MKLIAFLITLVIALTSCFALGKEGQSGNGGAGVYKNGRYQTFYSAGLYTEPLPINEPQKIAGLDDLINFIRNFAYISEEDRLNFIGQILPSSKHQYFNVNESQFDEVIQARLLAEFSRVTGQPAEVLKLFAITDVNSKITYLLPAYNKLSPQEKVTALFHENYWLSNFKADYQQTINAEMAFQAVLDQPTNNARISELLKFFGNNSDRFYGIVQQDLAEGNLDSLFLPKSKNIPFVTLLGAEFFDCLNRTEFKGAACKSLIRLNLYKLMTQNPRSLLLKYLYDRSTEFDIGFGTHNGETGSRIGGLGSKYYGLVFAKETRSEKGNFKPIEFGTCYVPLNVAREFGNDVFVLRVYCKQGIIADRWLSSLVPRDY